MRQAGWKGLGVPGTLGVCEGLAGAGEVCMVPAQGFVAAALGPGV